MTNTEAAKKLQDQIRIAQRQLAMTRCPATRRELAQRISAFNVALSVVAQIDRVDAARLGY